MSDLYLGRNKETHSLAMPSLVFSIFSIVFAGTLIWPMLGLLLSIGALKNFKENPERYQPGGRKLASIARICSIIGLVFTILFWLFIITIYVFIFISYFAIFMAMMAEMGL